MLLKVLTDKAIGFALLGVALAVSGVRPVSASIDCYGRTPVIQDPDQGESEREQMPDFTKIFKIPEAWKQLGKGNPIWIDRDKHLVIVGGQICLTAGGLEMFACPRHTREHESIVSVDVPSRAVHAALLAVGAHPGSPVQFDPEYQPARGPKVEISVRWMDDGKQIEHRAQDLVRRVTDKSPMTQEFVFGGSVKWTDEDTGKEYYSADGGELVCVSNFNNATMDLPIASTSSNGSLLFEANTPKIPALGTPVLMILQPEVAKADNKDKESANPSDEKPSKEDESASKKGSDK